ncbi:MAG: diacylglycerol kinase family protein [Bacteroidota bacterium]|nr:diacylglycerol kinase family protein [Bacteroidota bacterium]MDP4204627.1 diacylglycerol kinase family protein [Bacteroidota bacterium]
MKKRIFSFKYAFTGIYELIKSEPNARIHLAATICAVAAGFFLQISTSEWCFVIFAIAIVFAAEAFNTVFEKLVDHLFKEYHETARLAKDIAAGGVLICAIAAFIVGLIIFLPKVLQLL